MSYSSSSDYTGDQELQDVDQSVSQNNLIYSRGAPAAAHTRRRWIFVICKVRSLINLKYKNSTFLAVISMSSSSDFTGDQELQDVDQSVCLSNLIDSISELQLCSLKKKMDFCHW